MNNYEKALALINSLQVADYFVFMKNLIGENPALAKLQQRFIMGKTDEDFYEQLKAFAEMNLNKPINNNDNTIGNGSVLFQDIKNGNQVSINLGSATATPKTNHSTAKTDLKTLYNTLNQQLNYESLSLFCQLNFEEVHNNFTDKQSKVNKISALLDYAKRKDMLAKLATDLQEFLA